MKVIRESSKPMLRKVTSPLSATEEAIGQAVVHAAYGMHRNLGPGLLASVYEACFCHELNQAGYATQRQVSVPVIYDGLQLEDGFRLDVLVEQQVICELKAAIEPHPVFLAQLMTCMRLSQKRLGYLINFNVPLIKDGIKRVVL